MHHINWLIVAIFTIIAAYYVNLIVLFPTILTVLHCHHKLRLKELLFDSSITWNSIYENKKSRILSLLSYLPNMYDFVSLDINYDTELSFSDESATFPREIENAARIEPESSVTDCISCAKLTEEQEKPVHLWHSEIENFNKEIESLTIKDDMTDPFAEWKSTLHMDSSFLEKDILPVTEDLPLSFGYASKANNDVKKLDTHIDGRLTRDVAAPEKVLRTFSSQKKEEHLVLKIMFFCCPGSKMGD